MKFWIYFGHSWLPVNDWIFYPPADYIAQSWRFPLTPRRRQPAANNMRELNFRSHLPQHYFCSRLLLLDLLQSDQKENDAWNPLLLCSSSFRVTEENHTMPKCGLHTKYLPATFAWILLLGTTGAFFYYPWVPSQ